MIIRIGDKIIHGGKEFVIMNIKHEQTMEGNGLIIQCVDPETADHMQQNKMKANQVGDSLLDMVRTALKKLEKGEGGGRFEFPIGGE